MAHTAQLLFADILIASAEADFARQLRVVLQNAGYTVRLTYSCEALLRALELKLPDLLLLDAALPDVEGATLVRHIKAQNGQIFLPIILLSENAGEANFAAAINAGADEVLNKPISNVELLVRVRSMLRLKASTDELRALNATLEAKVLARTQALEVAHAALRHTEKLSALGRLAASVAHEINNPLAGILTYIYLMKHEIPAELRLSSDLDLIERQVNAIAGLVRQLQYFSKPPQHARKLVDVAQIWTDVLALVRKDLEQRKIGVVLDVSPNLPPVLASADQLGEVFMNLTLNARDAMPEGGQLTIRIAPEGTRLAIRVSDTGVGIPPEVQERLFEPFFTTKGEQGTGLGLAICYRIIEEHAGEIHVESALGVGTTFIIHLPLTPLAGDAEGDEGGAQHVHQLENP